MKKITAIATTLTLLVTCAVPVLADENIAVTTPSKSETHQISHPDKAIKTDKVNKASERLEINANKLKNQEQFKQELEPIRALQKQELDLRQQLRSLRNQIRQQIQTDRQTKNYTALAAALNDMILLQPDLDSIESAAKASFVDWQQYHNDCQSNNTSAITSDLQKLQSDIQAKITAQQKLLTDLQKISQDLNIPASAEATSSTETTSTTTSVTNN